MNYNTKTLLPGLLLIIILVSIGIISSSLKTVMAAAPTTTTKMTSSLNMTANSTANSTPLINSSNATTTSISNITTVLPKTSETQRVPVPFAGTIRTDVTPGIAKALGLKEAQGSLVLYVYPGSPAAKAGIHDGNANKTSIIDGKTMELGGDIILKINNTNVTKSSDISNYIINKKVGENVKLTIFRDGQIKEINLTIDTIHAVSQEEPWIAAVPTNASGSGNNVYAVWHENATGNYTIFFSRSTDGGATFSKPSNLSNNSIYTSNRGPRIAASGDNVYLAWSNDALRHEDVFLTTSTDGGASFSKLPINLSHSVAAAGAFAGAGGTGISIAQAGNNLYVTWVNKNPVKGNNEIFLKTIHLR